MQGTKLGRLAVARLGWYLEVPFGPRKLDRRLEIELGIECQARQFEGVRVALARDRELRGPQVRDAPGRAVSDANVATVLADFDAHYQSRPGLRPRGKLWNSRKVTPNNVAD